MSFGTEMFGQKPTLPQWETLNLQTEQNKAIASNIAAQPQAAKLANLTEDQIMSMLKQVIPNWDQISGSATGNIESLLKGEVPADVTAAVSKSASSQALFGGYGGTGASRNLVARDLGLTSLQLTGQGLSQAESWMSATERLLSPAISDYQSMFITPGEQASFDVNERNQKFAYGYLNSQIQAMPDPLVANAGSLGFYGALGISKGLPQWQNSSSSSTGGGAPDSSGWDTAQYENNPMSGSEQPNFNESGGGVINSQDDGGGAGLGSLLALL